MCVCVCVCVYCMMAGVIVLTPVCQYIERWTPTFQFPSPIIYNVYTISYETITNPKLMLLHIAYIHMNIRRDQKGS